MTGATLKDEEEIIRRGKEAYKRKRQGWADWMVIAEAVEVGQQRAMRAANTNRPFGRAYTKVFGEWMKENPEFGDGYEGIGRVARCNLLKCLDHRLAIEEWRESIPVHDRLAWNHPITVWRHFSAAQEAKAPKKAATPRAPIDARSARAEGAASVSAPAPEPARDPDPQPSRVNADAAATILSENERLAEENRKLAAEAKSLREELRKARADVQKQVDQRVDAYIEEKLGKEAREAMKLAKSTHAWSYARKLPFSEAEFRTLLKATHPDTAHDDKARREAFLMLNDRRDSLVRPAERGDGLPADFPRTAEELAARRKAGSAEQERKANVSRAKAALKRQATVA